jgi:MFS transporter, ACS family, phthalate transporter
MERRWHWAISAFVTAVAVIGLSQINGDLYGALITLSIINVGYLCIAALFFTIPTAFLSGSAAAGGLALVSAMGQVGGFLAPIVIGHVKQSTGSFALSLMLVAALLLVAACFVIFLIPAGIFAKKAAAR